MIICEYQDISPLPVGEFKTHLHQNWLFSYQTGHFQTWGHWTSRVQSSPPSYSIMSYLILTCNSFDLAKWETISADVLWRHLRAPLPAAISPNQWNPSERADGESELPHWTLPLVVSAKQNVQSREERTIGSNLFQWCAFFSYRKFSLSVCVSTVFT